LLGVAEIGEVESRRERTGQYIEKSVEMWYEMNMMNMRQEKR
jgi:hypothetical protein